MAPGTSPLQARVEPELPLVEVVLVPPLEVTPVEPLELAEVVLLLLLLPSTPCIPLVDPDALVEVAPAAPVVPPVSRGDVAAPEHPTAASAIAPASAATHFVVMSVLPRIPNLGTGGSRGICTPLKRATCSGWPDCTACKTSTCRGWTAYPPCKASTCCGWSDCTPWKASTGCGWTAYTPCKCSTRGPRRVQTPEITCIGPR